MKKIYLLFLLTIIGLQFAYSQKQITGTIISADDGLGVIGATVIVKGTTIGVVADIDGNYKITVPEGSNILQYSFLGMKSQEVTIGDQAVINIVLATDIFKLEEVIVAGVASATPKRKMSVSVTKVGSEDLQEVPATSAATALQGKVAGITIVNGGSPGSGSSIRLRSSTSILGDQTPLIIVDGIMMEGSLSDINVDDIDAMEVVKGAAASALYGSRAGAGVINIRTKRGNSATEGNTDIRIRNEFGISQLSKEISMATHHPYRLADDYQQTGYTKYYGVKYPVGYKGGGDSRIVDNRVVDFDHYADNPYSFTIDPQKEIFLDGNFYTNYVSVANNGAKSAIMVSFENNHNSGIVFSKKGSDRQSFRVNADLNVTDKIKISSSTNIIETKIDGPSEGTAGSFYDMLFMNPDVNFDMDAPISDSTYLDKYFYRADHWALKGNNPKHALYYFKQNDVRNSVMQNINATATIFKWLVAEADYSIEKRNSDYSLYMPVGYRGAEEDNRNGTYGRQASNGLSQTFATTLNLNQKFGDLVTKGKVSYMFEKSAESLHYGKGDYLLASGITTLEAVSLRKVVYSYDAKSISKNYFGIIDMDYKDRYIASFLYRLDGSSLFGENARWNPYYRYSLAYRLSEDIKINNVQELKLRYSVGTSGQRPGYDFQYETYRLVNGTYRLSTLGNKDLKPSETKETEMGINIQFFEKFEADVTYSFNETKGSFIDVPLPAISAFVSKWTNAATLSGRSFEISLSSQIVKTSDWEWRMNLSFDRIRQEISELSVVEFARGPKNGFYYKEGEAFGVMYGRDWVRSLDQMKKQLPAKQTIDNYTVNSDGLVIVMGTEGTISEAPVLLNNGSLVKIADMNPDFNMSLNSNLTWKNITVSMLWSWKNGGQVYNNTKQSLYLDSRHGDTDQADKDPYKKKTLEYYKVLYDGLNSNSYFVEDGSYLKLREVSINYSLGKSISKIKGLQFVKGVKIGLLARNLLTFTKYSGWDPEVASGGDASNYAFDDFQYPNYRSYTASMEIRF